MPIPDLESVIDTLQKHVHVPEGTKIEPTTRLEKLGINDVIILALLDDFSSQMRLPYDEKPSALRLWFSEGLIHERSEKQKAAGIDFGSPNSVQRLYQVIFQGFMEAENFNEIGSS